MPNTMRAVQVVQQGQPLALREIILPEAGKGELRIRVEAAGICHSDAHYRSGTGSVAKLPITLGHEVAGRVDQVGEGVTGFVEGDRVALHYLVTCGHCDYCRRGLEQFCREVQMLGKHRDGGYADYIVAPAMNAICIADSVSSAAAAVMMCSSATAFHAMRKARVVAGDRVAVFGIGGLGLSALQLARIAGVSQVFAIDIDQQKLAQAAALGAIPIHPGNGSVEQQIRDQTQGAGVDVALEFAGIPTTQQQAVAVLAPQGRAALAGICKEPFAVDSFGNVINYEAEIIGVSDHLRSELVTLMEFAARGQLDLDSVIAERLPLDANAINHRLDDLSGFRANRRAVITP
ncbi:MAG: zinc-binding dehydrogenase [Thermomonas sp.]|uniref:alcohol dehydrogenase catalytic domain-containing protein n=1 Tax=Thermomonas sp. TaxID=1971895 RepID=UPI001ED59FC0|nr:zinc-binding dehydrogenase [Thermomonas sp.]MBV2209608.1 zinc-binding dehydrogenase [Thermomonas sp.]